MSNQNLLDRHPILQQARALKIKAEQMRAANATRLRMVESEEKRVRQGINAVNGPRDVAGNLRNHLPEWLAPGNVGDVNKVYWPYFFQPSSVEMAPASGGVQSTGSMSFSVTQEAAFVLMAITSTVFKKTTGPLQYTAIDPETTGANGKAPGLSFILADAQSRRQFMPSPLAFDHIGGSRFPFELQTPMLFLPNSTVMIDLYNTDTTNTYVPWLTFFGYRVRIEDAEQLLSLVSG